MPTKLKLNNNSSIERELVAALDLMPMILRTESFLEVQGYDAEENEDYKSADSELAQGHQVKCVVREEWCNIVD